VLRRRDGYRRVYEGFDPVKIAAWGEAEIATRLEDPAIIRNRAKVRSAVRNARAFLDHFAEPGSFATFLWGFVDGEPVHNAWTSMGEMPAETEVSRAMSRELKRRGFNFVGPTICYAFMQSMGLVNDHLVGCFRHRELGGEGRQASPSR
jgi:DNA-3-methyladenine glycosylase I